MSIVVRGERSRQSRRLQNLFLGRQQSGGCTGLYVLPGLINTHIHIATDTTREEALRLMRRDLYSGVTASATWQETHAARELARVSLLGEVAGPIFYYAA